jgi:hypothetical protein
MFSRRYLWALLPPVCALIASSQTTMAQVKIGGTGPFVNLQLLKPVEVAARMTAYGQALGVACARCHMPANYATDEAADKVIARQMITLTRDINARYFGGAEVVTCYTCHRGTVTPETQPVR